MKMKNYKKLILNSSGLKKFLAGHIRFSKRDIFALKEVEPGELVKVFSREGYFLGIGFCNPSSFWVLRLLAKEDVKIDEGFFYHRFQKALMLRKHFYEKQKVFRLIFAEGDFLPGLIVDVFNEVVVVQTFLIGMEKFLPEVIKALEKLLSPKGIVLKNDAEKRKEEGLSLYVRVEKGGVKEPLLVEVDEVKFLIPVLSGQKTGFFLDQRENRRFVKKVCQGKELVVDCFCYTGGFGFYALKGGAKKAMFVDRSEFALDLVEEIAKINGFKDRVLTVHGDVFRFLSSPCKADVLVVDPPAFIKSHRAINEGKLKYEKLNHLAFKAIQKESFLFSFSCSTFFTLEDLKKTIFKCAVKAGKDYATFYESAQPPDHPVNPSVPETLYLKGLGLYIF